MNKLILIGNGFDISHGLEVSYADFVNHILQIQCVDPSRTNPFFQIKVKDPVIQSEFKELIDKKRSPRENLLGLIDLMDKTRINGEKRFALIYKNELFRKAFSSDYISWAGFEKSYYDSLTDILNRHYKNQMHTAEKEAELVDIIELNAQFEEVKSTFIAYLNEVVFPRISSVRPRELFDDWFKNSIIDKKPDENEIKFRKVAGKDSKPNNILFLCFNYTQILENVYGIKDEVIDEKIQKVVNIHGDLSDPSRIIFGYGDEMDGSFKRIENYQNSILQHFKSFQYAKSDNYHLLEAFVESDHFQVDILGHSCGTCDRVMLNFIFEHKFCNRIRVHFYEDDQKKDNFTDIYMNLSRHFSPNKKHEMRSKILSYNRAYKM